MIAIIDYGVGNIESIVRLYKLIGMPVRRASEPSQLYDASHLVLPGVGSFDSAMSKLNNSGLRSHIEKIITSLPVPLLGICVGMQMLASGSDEGVLPGMGLIPGRVRKFALDNLLPVPHMGWNQLDIRRPSPLFDGIESRPLSYFLHSYYFDANDTEDVIATASYGLKFDCVVSRGNVYGIQSHPEKSHQFGIKFLRNFANINQC